MSDEPHGEGARLRAELSELKREIAAICRVTGPLREGGAARLLRMIGSELEEVRHESREQTRDAEKVRAKLVGELRESLLQKDNAMLHDEGAYTLPPGYLADLAAGEIRYLRARVEYLRRRQASPEPVRPEGPGAA